MHIFFILCPYGGSGQENKTGFIKTFLSQLSTYNTPREVCGSCSWKNVWIFAVFHMKEVSTMNMDRTKTINPVNTEWNLIN